MNGGASSKGLEDDLDQPYLELYDLDADLSESTNVHDKHFEVAEKLIAQITEIVQNGRTTPGEPQGFVKGKWPQLTWMELD